jgi:predicted  nucleic acid-binding Zn-ribbon protein
MSSQISDLFKRIKELEDKIQSQNDQWDSDYQNIVDQNKDADVKHDSLRTNISSQATKIDKLNEKIEKLEKELGIEEKKPDVQQYMGYYGL